MNDADTSIRTIDVAIPAHNVAHCIGATLDAVLAQSLPPATRLCVYVTDDGSADGLRALLAERYAAHVVLEIHPTNRGRSAACNTAINCGHGEVVIVLDADCRFADTHMIARMLAHFDAGADAVLGTVDAEGSGFWATYAGLVSARRVAQAQRDGPWHMTTANFAVRRTLLTTLGGFSAEYRHYGFEDRDLLIRLARTGAAVVVDSAIVVNHREPASVREVCWKLHESGRHTARAFAARFPAEYRRSAYHRFDLSQRRGLARIAAPLLGVLSPLSQTLSDSVIRQSWAGFGLQAFSLRVASAFAYLQGTCQAALDTTARERENPDA